MAGTPLSYFPGVRNIQREVFARQSDFFYLPYCRLGLPDTGYDCARWQADE